MGAKVLIDIVMRGAGTASAQMSKLGGVFVQLQLHSQE